jgi:hypothetical protein
VAFGSFDQLGEPLRQLHSAALDSNENEAVGAVALFDDLGSHAIEGAGNRPGIKEGRAGGHAGAGS